MNLVPYEDMVTQVTNNHDHHFLHALIGPKNAAASLCFT